MKSTRSTWIAGHLLAIIPWVTTTLFLFPIATGLIGTWLPAFGWLPAANADEFSLQPWWQLFAYPGFDSALIKTLTTGLGAALLSLLLSAIFIIGLYPSRLFRCVERSLAPLLSVPHAAFAVGIGLLVMPSGWLVRLIANLTGLLPQPPGWITFQDAEGISLLLTLALKETPFLVFMALAILPTLETQRTLTLAASLGHSRRFAWLWLLFPRLYKQIRLPFYAVVAYSLTVVDIAMIAGPTTPPTLAVLINQWFQEPDFQFRLVGAAGATLLLLLNLIVLLLLFLSERPLAKLRHQILSQGVRAKSHWIWERPLALFSAGLFGVIYCATFALTLLWSLTGRWRYPDLWPEPFSGRSWQRILDRIAEPFWPTLWLALISALLAVSLSILALENEVRLQQKGKRFNSERVLLLLYLPLLIPQIAFLFGFQVFLIQLNWDANFISLLWSHSVFVIPYVFLTLSGPYRKFDSRYTALALSLKSGPFRSFWRVKLQMLLRPILYAIAIGFSVSIAQYLPTIFIGAGRYATLTTETVAMASGSDRRLLAVMAIWQQALPLIIFFTAALIPVIRYRNRKALQ